MKKSILITIFLFGSLLSFSQGGFYIGYKNGGIFDRYHYVNDKGYTLSQTSIGGLWEVMSVTN